MTQQSNGSCNVTGESQLLCWVFKKHSFFFQKRTKNLRWAKSTALPTTMPCFYPIADIAIYCWLTMKSCYRNWTHCVLHINTWTVSIPSSNIDSVEIFLSSVVKCLILCTEESVLIKETEEWTECLATSKALLWKKYRNQWLSSFQKAKLLQTSGSVIAERFEQVKKTKQEVEFWKLVDCFLDCFGSCNSSLVAKKLRFFKVTVFATRRCLKKWSGGANEKVIRAIISPREKKKPTNEQAPTDNQTINSC